MLRRPHLVGLILALVLPVSWVSAPGAAAKTRANCGVKGVATIARTAETRVVTGEDPDADLYDDPYATYVCHGPRGKARRIDYGISPERIAPTSLVLSGRYVAYTDSWVDSACSKYEGSASCATNRILGVWDATTGKRRTSFVWSGPDAAAGFLALSLSPAGTVGTLSAGPATDAPSTSPPAQTTPAPTAPAAPYVLAVAAKGATSTTVIARDATILPASLRVTRDAVSWTAGDGPHTHALR